MSEREPVPHKITNCAECGGRLGWDKHPYISENGFCYRVRICDSCGKETHTKQGPEVVTAVTIPNPENPSCVGGKSAFRLREKFCSFFRQLRYKTNPFPAG
jgi:hypothetical protein